MAKKRDRSPSVQVLVLFTIDQGSWHQPQGYLLFHMLGLKMNVTIEGKHLRWCPVLYNAQEPSALGAFISIVNILIFINRQEIHIGH